MKNFINEEEITGQSTRLSDGNYIPSQDYTHCCRVLKKSSLDSADILYVLDLDENLKNSVRDLINLIHKLSQVNKRGTLAIIDDIKKIEEGLSLSLFKKTRKCLTREEHLKILREDIKNLSQYSKVVLKSNNLTNAETEYYWDLEYLNYQ